MTYNDEELIKRLIDIAILQKDYNMQDELEEIALQVRIRLHELYLYETGQKKFKNKAERKKRR